MTGPIIETQATGPEVERLADKIIPILEGEERSLAVITMLTLVLSIVKPEITSDEVFGGVKGISEWMCMYLADQPKVQAN